MPCPWWSGIGCFSEIGDTDSDHKVLLKGLFKSITALCRVACDRVSVAIPGSNTHVLVFWKVFCDAWGNADSFFHNVIHCDDFHNHLAVRTNHVSSKVIASQDVFFTSRLVQPSESLAYHQCNWCRLEQHYRHPPHGIIASMFNTVVVYANFCVWTFRQHTASPISVRILVVRYIVFSQRQF